jgi:hypothetical protein
MSGPWAVGKPVSHDGRYASDPQRDAAGIELLALAVLGAPIPFFQDRYLGGTEAVATPVRLAIPQLSLIVPPNDAPTCMRSLGFIR